MSDLELPVLTSSFFIIMTFIVALAVFHLTLVWFKQLSETAWKKIDYIWLSFALLGIVGSVASGRQIISANMLSIAGSRLDFRANKVEERIAFGRSSAVCRKFVRSEFSPPPEEFDRMQKEFDEQCAWFNKASEKIKNTPFSKKNILHIEDLGTPVPSGGVEWAITSLEDAIKDYNEAVERFNKLTKASKRSDIEISLIIVGPIFIVIALALRITKVTAEIKFARNGNTRTSA